MLCLIFYRNNNVLYEFQFPTVNCISTANNHFLGSSHDADIALIVNRRQIPRINPALLVNGFPRYFL